MNDCFNNYVPNQWLVFFLHSDWLLKLVIVSAILVTYRRFLEFARIFPEKRKCLVLAITGLLYTKIIIHIIVSEE